MVKNLPQLLLVCSLASAATQEFTVQTLRTATSWNQGVNVPRFNPALGTLDSVRISFRCDVDGTVRAENLDIEAGALLTGQINAGCSIPDAVPGLPLGVNPVVAVQFNASAFDNVLDYGGSSGFTSSVLTDSKSIVSGELTAPAVLSQFTGVGNYGIMVFATGLSSATGSGFVSSVINTFAQGFLTVEYTYTPRPDSVPQPNTPTDVPTLGEWGLMALAGLLGLYGVRRSTASSS